MTVSSTGIATPSVDARVMGRMGFRSDISRVPVFGLGCAGGATGLSIAARLAEARPGSTVLLVVLELCTLAFRMDELTKANVVASALFGDGAAACILRVGEGGLARVAAAGEHTWPDTLDIMGWNVDPLGFGVVFAQAIPPFARENVGPAVTAILGRSGLTIADVDRFICHPGGAKVITALESALGMEDGTLDHERDVLSSHGNMSAPDRPFRPRTGDRRRIAESLARERHGARLFDQLRRPGESGVTLAVWCLVFVTLQRAVELLIASRNTSRLIARGAVEASPGHYPLIVLVHACWLAGLWVLGWDRPVHLGWLAVFALLQGLRVWIIATLGERWTTRIIVLPGEKLVRRGPYRFLSHPNYVVVVGEIAVVAAGPWAAVVRACLLDPQRGRPEHSHSRREPRLAQPRRGNLIARNGLPRLGRSG